MKSIDASACEVHVDICTNEKPGGRTCCKRVGGQEFYDRVKTKLRETGLNRNHWATRTGCLGFCNDVGTTVTIHREGQPTRWFNEVTAEDFDAIWMEILRVT